MKKIILLLFLISYTVSFSQSEKADVELFYYTAIKNHIDNARAMFKKVGSEHNVSDLYFVTENVSSEYLPKQIEDYKINYINIYHKKNKKVLKKGIHAVSIQLIQLNGNQVVIDLIDFIITKKKRNYTFSNGGGSLTTFEYDCETNKWRYLETKFSGV